ncbi:MAG TPA: glycosyltransferase family 4 protein [Stellaceae bacterium]
MERGTALVRVATRGAVTDIRSFGGAPYYIWRNLARLGVNVVAHDTPMHLGFPLRRLAWNLRQLAAGRGVRGYMFSNDFLEFAWSNSPPVEPGDLVLNYCNFYPESLLRRAERGDISLFYYMDLTLHELFNEWGPASSKSWWLGRGSQAERAVAFERRGYLAARKVITLSRRSADVLASRYGIDPGKIVTIAPGANLDDDEVERVLDRTRPTGDFIVGFVGMDYRRKGLLKLASAVLDVRRTGVPISLRVIGARPRELEDTPGIDLVGEVNKTKEMGRLIELMAGCHLGCLLSQAEGLPIALVEFLRLGVPVLGTSVNGIPDVVTDEVGILVEPTATSEEIGALLSRLAQQGSEYRRLRAGAESVRHRASWRRAAGELHAAMLS